MSDELDIEQEPAAAVAIFGSGIDLARAYTQRLAADSETFGLLGPRELPKIWSRHVINSALLSELVPDGSLVADVGLVLGSRVFRWQSLNRMPISPSSSQWSDGQTGLSPW
jgi:hypothetical protein